MHQRDSATSIFDHPCNRSSEASQHGSLAVRVTCQNGRAPRTFEHLRRAGTKLRLLAPGGAGPEIQSGEGMEDIDFCTDRYHDIIHKSYIYNPHYTCKINISTVYIYIQHAYHITLLIMNLGNNLDPNMARLQHIFKDQAPQLLASWTWIQKVSESQNFSDTWNLPSTVSIHSSLLQGSSTSWNAQCHNVLIALHEIVLLFFNAFANSSKVLTSP